MTAGYLKGTTKVPVTVSGVTTVQTIPNVPLLLKAIEQLTTVDVLSNPMLTTVDNKEAVLTIGQEVPTPSSQNSGDTGLVIQSRIERKEVGVKLKVKPQINEGDYVSMETEVEVSKPIASEIGIDPNKTGPTFQKSLITNSMIIKDSEAGVMVVCSAKVSTALVRSRPSLAISPSWDGSRSRAPPSATNATWSW